MTETECRNVQVKFPSMPFTAGILMSCHAMPCFTLSTLDTIACLSSVHLRVCVSVCLCLCTASVVQRLLLQLTSHLSLHYHHMPCSRDFRKQGRSRILLYAFLQPCSGDSHVVPCMLPTGTALLLSSAPRSPLYS